MATTSLVIDDTPVDDYFLNFRYSKDEYTDENGQVIAYHPVRSNTFRAYEDRNELTYLTFKDDIVAKIEDVNITEIHIRTNKTPSKKDSVEEINRLRLEELLKIAKELKTKHGGEGWVYLPPIFEYQELWGLISMPRYMIEVQFKNVSDYNSLYGILNLCFFSSITPYSSESFEAIKKMVKEISFSKMCKDFFGTENE